MEHGRDHDQRQSQLGQPRANNTPPDEPETDLEAEMLHAGRGGIVPRQGLVGAHEHRGTFSDTGATSMEGQEPLGAGSECAPTRQAAERERVRHELERQAGRIPAGEEGRVRDTRAPGVTREALDEAAREADRRVAGHEIRKQGE
jgi:hypothetical protein